LADAPEELLLPVVKQWHEAALPRITTKPFEETWYDFRIAWRRVRYAAGDGKIDEALARAVSQTPPVCADKYEDTRIRTLVALCRELQRVADESPFFLACRTAGQLLGVSHTLTSRWLGMLCMDGILKLVERGSLHHANEYRYLGDL
jgi:hypothetical protein